MLLADVWFPNAMIVDPETLKRLYIVKDPFSSVFLEKV
jgi:hypothetical protein